MTTLLTGGAGFIGSHMSALLLEYEHDFVVVDNLTNSDVSQLKKLEKFFKKKYPLLNVIFAIRAQCKLFLIDMR